MWSQSLEKGFRCSAKSSDVALWSLERPLEGLGQIDDVTNNTTWGLLVWKPCGDCGGMSRARGPVRKRIVTVRPRAAGRVSSRKEGWWRCGPHVSSPLNHPRSQHAPNHRADTVNASLLPLSVFNMVDLCKTGSSAVTMALFVAEQRTFENSKYHGCLVLHLSRAYEISLRVGPFPAGAVISLCSANRMNSRAALFLRQGTRLLRLSGTPSCVGPWHSRRERLAQCQAGTAKPRRFIGRSQETLPGPQALVLDKEFNPS